MKFFFALLFLFPAISHANCDSPVSQPEITQCAIDEYTQLTAEMNDLVPLVEFCTNSSIGNEQEQWHKFVAASCRKELSAEKGGSLYHHMYVSCLGKNTTDRIAVFEAKSQSCFK